MEGSLVVRNNHGGDVPLGTDIDHSTIHPTALFPSGSTPQNGLFSTSHLAANSLILSISSPFVLIPDNEALTTLCNYCFASRSDPSHELKKCAACHLAVYCSKACQEAAWRECHRWECKAFQRVEQGRVSAGSGGSGGGFLPTPVRALIVLVMKYLKLGGGTGSGKFWGLVSNSEHWRRGDRESVMLQSLGAVKYGGIPEKPGRLEEVEEAWCILKTNAFRASSATGPVGLCFDPKLAVANHSCDPSAEIGFEGRTLFMRALRDIGEKEEITISYMDETQDFETRQEHLKSHYLFECNCSRCAEEKGFGPRIEDTVD